MNINWVKVQFREEAGEFERVAADFSGKKSNPGYQEIIQNNVKYLESVYRSSNLVQLNDVMWRDMHNTDSWRTTSILAIQRAIKSNKEQRSIEGVLIEYFSGKVRAPIVILLKDKTSVLVGGNTRLMVARMLKIKPKIILIKTDW